MKKLTLAAIGAASLACAGPAFAQSFTYDVTWEPVESYGGLTGADGPQYGGGSVKGTYVSTQEDGSAVNGTVRCVGVAQPDGGVFALHLSCTATDEQGTYSLAYGCNYLGKPGPGTALGCVGAMEAKGGEGDGQRGGLTMHWYAADKSSGTGHWYTAE